MAHTEDCYFVKLLVCKFARLLNSFFVVIVIIVPYGIVSIGTYLGHSQTHVMVLCHFLRFSF